MCFLYYIIKIKFISKKLINFGGIIVGTIRIDKMLSNSGIGSRKDVKNIIKSGKVTVDGKIIKSSDLKIDPENSKIIVNGKELTYKKNIYLLMNKPAGVISATYDKKEKTVIDILPNNFKNIDLFPVGRLDKDTVGMLILTNDGDFAHNTLSPKKHVWKKYYATVSGIVTQEDIQFFEKGVEIGENEICKSAKLQICTTNDNTTNVTIEISEGKFHQIKRMFKAVGKEVLFLKRIKFGGLELDENIAEGSVRELSEIELKKIFEN